MFTLFDWWLQIKNWFKHSTQISLKAKLAQKIADYQSVLIQNLLTLHYEVAQGKFTIKIQYWWAKWIRLFICRRSFRRPSSIQRERKAQDFWERKHSNCTIVVLIRIGKEFVYMLKTIYGFLVFKACVFVLKRRFWWIKPITHASYSKHTKEAKNY